MEQIVRPRNAKDDISCNRWMHYVGALILGYYPKPREVTMVAANAREVLKKENELLNELAQRAAASSVGSGWADFIRGWRENNEKLIAMDDSAFAKELNEEIKRLESMRSAITGDSPGAKYWKDSLSTDIANSKELL